MHIFESSEDYLERILMLQNSLGKVRSIDIATDMNYSKPSVSVAMKKLKENDYISVDDFGYITLTPKGYEISSNIYERHQIITKFLIKIGVSKAQALEDACKIEHDLSNETFEALKKHLL